MLYFYVSLPCKTTVLYNYKMYSSHVLPPCQGRRIKMRCPVKVLTGIFHPILLSAF